MNKIPKYKTKIFIPQANNLQIALKESNKENIPQKITQKITQKNLKFNSNRQFGKDITNSVKGNIHNLYNNHCTKIVTIPNKKQNNKIYIKKHSSASQASQKKQKLKIALNEKKLRENKSGLMINKKNDISVYDYYYINNKNVKNDYLPQQGSKLHSSISFGINNNNIRPISSNNNCISVRLSYPKNNKPHLNNRSINLHNNNYGNIENINYNNIINTHSNLDLM